jgi:hypothetical protein
MDRVQIDALVSQYLDAELQEVETRLAAGAWKLPANDGWDHGDWNSGACSLLADRAEELEQALAYNNRGDKGAPLSDPPGSNRRRSASSVAQENQLRDLLLVRP